REVLGLVTACGGGISLAELEELSTYSQFALSKMLSGAFGRSIISRTDSAVAEAQQVLLFAHETLRVHAVDVLGARLIDEFRHRVFAWADRYADAGWPKATPQYLLRGYPRML